jgi:hypothetical protein
MGRCCFMRRYAHRTGARNGACWATTSFAKLVLFVVTETLYVVSSLVSAREIRLHGCFAAPRQHPGQHTPPHTASAPDMGAVSTK